MTDTLEFTVRLKADDYVEWSLYLSDHKRPLPRKAGGYALWVGFFFGGFGLVFFYDWAWEYVLERKFPDCDGEFPKAEMSFLGFLPWLLLLIGASAYNHWARRTLIKGQLGSMMAGIAAQMDAEKTFRWIIEEEGLQAVGDDSDSRFAWSSVKQIAQTDTHIFLVSDFAAAMIVPRRDLSAPQIETLYGWFRRKGLLTAPAAR